MKAKILSLTIFLLLFLFMVIPSFAFGRPDFANKPDLSPTGAQNGKVRSCQAFEKSIKNRMTHLTKLSTTMEGKFDKIAQRVEEYYTSKVIPNGKTVANYDVLVADVQIKKDAVTAAIITAQTNADNFTCNSDNPKSNVSQFRTDMQNVKEALKEYRTSIKNLIVAIRSLTGAENRVTVTPTP